MCGRFSRSRIVRVLSLLSLALLVVGPVLGLAGLAGCGILPQTLASEGGFRVTLSVSCLAAQPACNLSAGRDSAAGILTTRLHDGLGLGDATVEDVSANVIEVQAPGATDSTLLPPVLTNPGHLQVLDSGETQLGSGTDVGQMTCTTSCAPGQYRVVFTEAQLARDAVGASLDKQTASPVVTFGFAGDARAQFADYTASHVTQYLTLAVDGRVVESAVIQSSIDGEAEISGFGSMHDAVVLAAELKARPLPVALAVTHLEQVKPTQG